jgi:MYXO-CTERM domain-containing protein
MKSINFLLCSGCIAALSSSAIAGVWINELHYDNAGGDVDEGVEIAADFVMDPSLLEVHAYNGSPTQLSVYNSWDAASFSMTEVAGGSLIWFTNEGSLQNGAPDGIAVVYDGSVVQFISYEGNPFTAADGAAMGMTSVDLGTSESSSTPVGSSLQLTGTADFYDGFTWAEANSVSTWGALNAGQAIGAIPAPGAIALLGLAGIAARRRRRH